MTKKQNTFLISRGVQFRIILLFVLLAFGLGCILHFSTALAILCLGVVTITILYRCHLSWLLITLLLITLALFWSSMRIDQIEHLSRLASKYVTTVQTKVHLLKIDSPPTLQNGDTKFVARVTGDTPLEHIKVKVSIRGAYPSIQNGDSVEVQGKMFIPENKEGETFDYVRFLAKDNIFMELSAYSISSHTAKENSSVVDTFLHSRTYLEQMVGRLWPGDVGGLVSGILIGTKSTISQKTSEAFRITGLSHIVAISGFNITIIIVFIFSLLSWLQKSTRVVCASIFIVLFVLFVGASAAVVRAGIMGVIGLLALYIERKSNVLTSLLISAVIMTVSNPLTLVYDIGFQLSFLAVLGLMYGEVFFSFLYKVPEYFGIREALLGTLSAQVTTLPITLYYFGSLSIISPVANIIVAPLIPLAMLTSFSTLILTSVPYFQLFAFIFRLITHYIMSFIITSTHWLSSLPFASIDTSFFKHPYVLMGSYGVIVLLAIFLQKKRRSNSVFSTS